jgi:hypothetical protein
VLERYYNNSILTTNPKTGNRTANSGLIDYIKEIAANENKIIFKVDHEIIFPPPGPGNI